MPVLEDIEEECTDELRGCCGQLLATNWESEHTLCDGVEEAWIELENVPTLVVVHGSMPLLVKTFDTRTPSIMGLWLTFVWHVEAYMFQRGPLCVTLFMGMMGQRGSKGIWILDMGRGTAQRFCTHFKCQVTLSLTFFIILTSLLFFFEKKKMYVLVYFM